MKYLLDSIQGENNMSTKANTLQKKKLLKAVRNRNKKVSSHNFETKTLRPVPPVPMNNTEQLIEKRQRHINHNKNMRIERGIK